MSLPPSDDLAQHAKAIRAFCAALCRQDSDASDVAQSAMVLALEKRGTRRGGLGGWLRGAARFGARERYRGDARRLRRETEAALDDVVPSAAERAARLEIEEKLMGWVRALPPEQSEAVYLRFWEDLAPREIAARLGVPVGTVKTRLKRGLGELRQQLSSDTPGGEARWMSILGTTPLGSTGYGTAGAAASGWIGMVLMKKAMAVAAAVLVAWGTWASLAQSPPPLDPQLKMDSASRHKVAALSEPARDEGRTPKAVPGKTSPHRTQAAPSARVVLGQVLNVGGHSEEAKGTPAAGVTVHLNWGMSIGPDAATAVTDAGGRFRLDVPARVGSELHVSVHGDERYRHATTSLEFSSAEKGERSCVVTRYLNGGFLGKITDLQRQPIEGVLVTVTPDKSLADQQPQEARTDESGRFHFAQLGSYRGIAFEAEDWILHSRSKPRQTKTGEWEEMEVFLARSGTLKVRVLDQSGTALEGVDIAVSPSAAEALGREYVGGRLREIMAARASTDGSGTATLEGVCAGQKLSVRAWLGRQSWSWDRQGAGSPVPGGSIVLTGAESGPITFHIGARRHIAGRVVDADNQPVSKGAVVLRSHGLQRGDPARVGISLETDEDGRFRFDYLAAAELGAGRLSAWDTEYWKLAQGIVRTPGVASREVDLQQSADEVILKLVATGEISGTVTDDSGGPVRARVTAVEIAAVDGPQREVGRLRNGVSNFTLAKANGSFRLGGLPEGDYSLRVGHRDYSEVTLAGVATGTTDLQVQLEGPPECTLHIEVIPPADVKLDRVALQTAAVRGDRPGSRSLPDLPARATFAEPGRCILPGSVPNGFRGIETSLGLVETMTFAIEGSRATRGVQSGPGWVAVMAFTEDGERLYPVGTGHVELTKGEHHLRFEMRRSGSISGTVRHPSNLAEPLFVALALPSGELLELPAKGAPKTMVELGARGDFQLDWLPAGEFELRVGSRGALASGDASSRQSLRIAPGPNPPVAIDLRPAR